MTRYPRLRMRLQLSERHLPETWPLATIDASDVAALGPLMLAAYRDTVDFEGEDEEDAAAEVERTLAGEYGPMIADCSFVASHEGRVVAASVVVLAQDRPLLAYLMVLPEMSRKGIGTLLLHASGNALLRAGSTELDLYVTEENDPAVTLYRKVGFEVIARLSEPPHEA
jgi:ribosomal protein S18 acetylase RimI-like enzyme